MSMELRERAYSMKTLNLVASEYLYFAALRLDLNVNFILFKRPMTTFGEEIVDYDELEEAETRRNCMRRAKTLPAKRKNSHLDCLSSRN